jgi:hypothetical protein
MKRLVIEYVFEGHRRGYNFTSPTTGFSEEALKTIWRTAMPRGQGWGADAYIGAASLKCFPVDEHHVALSEVTVTAQRDDGGRRGIRRAVVQVMKAAECVHFLQQRLDNFPPDIRDRLEEKRSSFWQRKNLVEQTLPKVRGSKQVIFSRTYSGLEDWLAVEFLVLKLAISRAEESSNQEIVPFTTLALDYREESRIVALPAQQTALMSNITIIAIP